MKERKKRLVRIDFEFCDVGLEGDRFCPSLVWSFYYCGVYVTTSRAETEAHPHESSRDGNGRSWIFVWYLGRSLVVRRIERQANAEKRAKTKAMP
jgi:hypothetical protein